MFFSYGGPQFIFDDSKNAFILNSCIKYMLNYKGLSGPLF